MPVSVTSRASLTLSLALAAAVAGAQQQAPAPQGGPHASNVRETNTIQRNTNQVANVGTFRETEVQRRPTAVPPNGDVGSTGTVAERRPEGELRGSVGPAPGEIDMTRPIGPADVARILRAYDPRLRGCYDRARATRPTLAGRVNLRFVVARDGTLTQVEANGMPEAPEVATCLRDELQRTVFPRPETGTLPYTTGMNFAPPATPPPARGRGGRGRRR